MSRYSLFGVYICLGECVGRKRKITSTFSKSSIEAARVLNRYNILLVGVESQTVGQEDAPLDVHLELLGQEVVLLEGIRLTEVPEGRYFLNAAPINMGGADGAPCRAVLLEGVVEMRT